MKTLSIILVACLTSCANLTPEQNGQLLNAGLSLGTAIAVKALNQK